MKRGYIDLKYEQQFSGLADITARVSYDFYKYDGDYIYDWAAPETSLSVTTRIMRRGSWWSAKLQINKPCLKNIE